MRAANRKLLSSRMRVGRTGEAGHRRCECGGAGRTGTPEGAGTMRKTMAAALAALVLAGGKVEGKERCKPPEVDVKDKPGGGSEVDLQPGRMPDVDVKTDSASVPDIKAPDIKAPDVKVPDIKAPHIEAPEVHLPVSGGRDTTHRRAPR